MPKLSQFEGVAWPLLQQRPAHLLSRRFATWDALMKDAAVEARDALSAQGPLGERTWGERNTAHICHPLAGAIPLLGERLLCMPPDQLDRSEEHTSELQSLMRISYAVFCLKKKKKKYNRKVFTPAHKIEQ